MGESTKAGGTKGNNMVQDLFKSIKETAHCQDMVFGKTESV